MKLNYLLILLLIAAVTSIAFLYSKIVLYATDELSAVVPCHSTFADGDGPYYKENARFQKKIVPENNHGTKLVVSGRVLKSDCQTAVKGIVLDIWQADENGKYQDTSYRGKIRVADDGRYEIETVVPKGYGSGTGYRPPHIHFKVWDGPKLVITSEMFFPEARGKPGFDEAYIMRLDERWSLWGDYSAGYHDIIMP